MQRWAVLAAGAASLAAAPSPPARAEVATGRAIVNSILSGYGLPTLRDVSGFTPLLEQYERLVVQFQYPSAWIVQKNTMPFTDSAGLTQYKGDTGAKRPVEGRASGLTAGDYRRAEGLSFYVSGQVPNGERNVKAVPATFIADLVTPGDATGNVPNFRITKDSVDEEGYRVIETKYESITVSGYTVGRKARTRAVILGDGKLYALTGSCTDTRWKKIGDQLDVSLASFRVFRL